MKNTEAESPTISKVSATEPKVMPRELYSTMNEAKRERRTPDKIVVNISFKEDLLNFDNPTSYLSDPLPFIPLRNKVFLA